MRRFIAWAVVLVCVCQGSAQAEIANQSPEKLQSRATHIATGVVKQITADERMEKDWLHIKGVVEIEVATVEKGSADDLGAKVKARYWRQRWRGQGNPPTYGSGHRLPKEGDVVRVYLKQEGEEFEALLPNGFEGIPKAPTRSDGK